MPRNTGADNLDALRDHAIAAVDEATGKTRAAYLTDIPGQSETYQDKLADCLAYLAEAAPDISMHPWVSAEAAAQNMTPTVAAQNVVDTYAAWRTTGITIESVRITAKRLIRDGATAPDICSARDTALNTLKAIKDAAPSSKTA